MIRQLTRTILMALTLGASHSLPIQAATVGFVASPIANSTEWSSFVALRGGTINTNLNFDTMPTGALIEDFYMSTDGVTLIGQNLGDVVSGAGPGESSTLGPRNSGEGLHPKSHYILDPSGFSTLTISFSQGVLGAGLFVIDYFNPFGNNALTIEAFDGVQGTGASLGAFSSVAFNFQENFVYFMGIATEQPLIRSIVFTDEDGQTGDMTGIDNIMFATAPPIAEPPAPVPLPASLPALAFALAVVVTWGRWAKGRRRTTGIVSV